MRLTVKRKESTSNFLELIRRRRQQFSSTKLAAQIVVPPDLKWWYWQQWGTALRGDPGYASGRTYDNPLEPTGFAFPDAEFPNTPTGYRVGQQLLSQPGIYPQHFVTKSIPEIMKYVGKNFMEAGHNSQYDPKSIRNDLLTNTMQNAISIIVSAIGKALPGTRPDGKLHGGTAAAVFEQEAKVRNVGS